MASIDVFGELLAWTGLGAYTFNGDDKDGDETSRGEKVLGEGGATTVSSALRGDVTRGREAWARAGTSTFNGEETLCVYKPNHTCEITKKQERGKHQRDKRHRHSQVASFDKA
jgi:hypothetical protein